VKYLSTSTLKDIELVSATDLSASKELFLLEIEASISAHLFSAIPHPWSLAVTI